MNKTHSSNIKRTVEIKEINKQQMACNSDCYEAFRKKKLVKGTIKKIYETHMEVDIGSSTSAILNKRHWIKKEKILYTPGAELLFYILSVRRYPFFKVELSRRSFNLPALLLKKELPGFNFKCHKRYPGDIAYIKTNIVITDKVKRIRNKVSRMLNGEILILKPYENNHSKKGALP